MSGFFTVLQAFHWPDLIAVLWLLCAWGWIAWRTEHPPVSRPSVSLLMKEFRQEWMRQLITRDTRIFDSNILTNLRESTAFFASATMIAIGGGLALIGNAEQIAGFAGQFEMGNIPIIKWEMKIIIPLLIVVDAFLKFVWSNRLFGYCAIIMGAVPNDPRDPSALPRAMQAAELNIRAARSFNAGLRSVYFALGALAWLAGALALGLAVTLVLYLSWRREFASGSRRALLEYRIQKSKPVDPATADVTPGTA